MNSLHSLTKYHVTTLHVILYKLTNRVKNDIVF